MEEPKREGEGQRERERRKTRGIKSRRCVSDSDRFEDGAVVLDAAIMLYAMMHRVVGVGSEKKVGACRHFAETPWRVMIELENN